MAITANRLKHNLTIARRPDPVELNATHRKFIREQVKQGTSKKLLTTIFSCSYEDIKVIIKC